MKRLLLTLAVATLAAAPPADAQWAGMPAWNSPKGGTGVTLSGEIGFPNRELGEGTALGARASLGLGNITLTAGLASWGPDGLNGNVTSIGGQVAFRVIGGGFVPFAVNLQGGLGRASEVLGSTQQASQATVTTLTGAVGVSLNLPTLGFDLEPYISPGIRYQKEGDITVGALTIEGEGDADVGIVIGANVSLGVLGFHIAYDRMTVGGRTLQTVGVGGHVALLLPGGL